MSTDNLTANQSIPLPSLVLAYQTSGLPGVGGQTVGANGVGQFAVMVYADDDVEAHKLASDYCKNLERTGQRLHPVICAEGDYYQRQAIIAIGKVPQINAHRAPDNAKAAIEVARSYVAAADLPLTAKAHIEGLCQLLENLADGPAGAVTSSAEPTPFQATKDFNRGWLKGLQDIVEEVSGACADFSSRFNVVYTSDVLSLLSTKTRPSAPSIAA